MPVKQRVESVFCLIRQKSEAELRKKKDEKILAMALEQKRRKMEGNKVNVVDSNLKWHKIIAKWNHAAGVIK